MNLFPAEKITYRTYLSKDEVLKRIYNNPQYKSIGNRTSANTFQIQREIKYRNSFLPVIKGEVIEENDSTIVKVSMKPHIIILLLFAAISGFVLLLCIVALIWIIDNGFTLYSLAPFGFLLFDILLYYAAFKPESIKSKKDLLNILEAEIVK